MLVILLCKSFIYSPPILHCFPLKFYALWREFQGWFNQSPSPTVCRDKCLVFTVILVWFLVCVIKDTVFTKHMIFKMLFCVSQKYWLQMVNMDDFKFPTTCIFNLIVISDIFQLTLNGPVHPRPNFWLALGGYQRRTFSPTLNSLDFNFVS